MDERVSTDGLQMALGIFDMDRDPSVDAKEIITMYGYESFDYVQPFNYPSDRVTDADKEFGVNESVTAEGLKVGIFSAEQPGYGSDNPSDPNQVTLQQAKRAININFIGTTKLVFGARLLIELKASHASRPIFPPCAQTSE